MRVKLRDELLAVQTRFEVPVVMITHDPEDIKVFAETLVTYETGRVCKVDNFLKEKGENYLTGANYPDSQKRCRIETGAGKITT